jgi:Protein of unknown function (DUF4232)
MRNYLRATSCAAVTFATAVMLSGCGGPLPPVVIEGHPDHFPSPQPTATAPVPQPVPVGITVQADPASWAAYAGQTVSATVLSNVDSVPGQQWPMAEVTVDFGDGSSGSATATCAGHGSSALTVSHVYGAGGRFAVHVAAVRFCDPAGQPQFIAADGTMLVLPAPPAGNSAWPQCGQAQLQMSARMADAGLGNRELLFTLRNVSSGSCQTYGYPGLRLAKPDGQLLPVTVGRGGAYLFPNVPPSRVVLAPGEIASFELGYAAGMSPVSSCRAFTEAEVFLPGSFTFTPVSLAGIDTLSDGVACGGYFRVSPVIPGGVGIGA